MSGPPPSVPLTAAVWAGGRSVADPRFSPDGHTVSFVAAGAGRAELASVSVDGPAPEQWFALDPPIKRVSAHGGGVHAWLPDGGIAYLGADDRLHRFDPRTSVRTTVTRWADSLSSLTISPAGAMAAYVVDLEHVAVVRTDAGEQWPQRISSGADFVVDPNFSVDGKWVVWHEWDVPHMAWDDSRIVARRSDGSGAVVHVAGGDGVATQQPRFSPDGAHLAFLSDASGWLNLWVADVVDGAFFDIRAVLDETYEHGGPVWGPGQRTWAWVGNDVLAFTRNESGRARLCLVTLSTGVVAEHADGSWSGLDANGVGVVGVHTNATEASTVRVAPFDRSAIDLARGPFAGVERAGTRPETVVWPSDDGVTIHGRLYRPGSADRPGVFPPLLVWVHGGPTGQSPATLYGRISYFVQRGWAVLVPDYRGSTGHGRAYQQALRHQWCDLDVRDVAAGIRHAHEQQWGDPRRTVAYGSSSGGTTTLLLLAHHGELLAAAVALYPVSDLVGFDDETWRFEAHYNESLIGRLPQVAAEYVRRSPITHAALITKPLLLLHGEADQVVPVSQTVRLAAAVERAGTGAVVETQIYSDEGHGWKRPATQIDELERMAAFLSRHVTNDGLGKDQS